MNDKNLGLNTICTQVGEIEDTQFKGIVSPIYLSTAYPNNVDGVDRYPRYLNTPNQEFLRKKLAALEQAEDALIFGSGMAAISTTLFAFLKAGDHIVVQNDIYGGTRHLIESQFENYNIEFTFSDGLGVSDFEKAIQPNTKLIYIETPSNPLLKLVDIKAIVKLSKSQHILSVIDNTFASPIIQNPLSLGIDIVLHSATKYLGGHSDISAGVVAASKERISKVQELAKVFGGNLSDLTVWMLERSIKTLGLRVKAQNKNAKKIAKFLDSHVAIKKVNYPGLKSHPDYQLAIEQMNGFGAMMSFELVDGIKPKQFLDALKLIKFSMSLGGVESTMILPSETSHKLLSKKERKSQGIRDSLIRFSLGIENTEDLLDDIEQAIVTVFKGELSTD
jgi:cystathionine beta-lyase